MGFQSPDSFMMTEGREILEWIGEYMKARGLTHLEVPWPKPTPEDLWRAAMVGRVSMAAAAIPGQMIMDIIAGPVVDKEAK